MLYLSDLLLMDFHQQFMQKVGKLDETKDEVFDEFVNNFNKQQVSFSYPKKALLFYFTFFTEIVHLPLTVIALLKWNKKTLRRIGC